MATAMKVAGPLAIGQNYFCSPKSSYSFPNFTTNLPKARNRMIPRSIGTTKAALIDFKNPTNQGVAENPVNIKITAEVNVRNVEYMDRIRDHWTNADPVQNAVILQLVSSNIDQSTMKARLSSEERLLWSKNVKNEAGKVSNYKVEFMVDPNFGAPAAILIVNKYEKEFYLENIVVEGVLHFASDSWIQPQSSTVCFVEKAYLPSETPLALKELRENELKELRGDGKGSRKMGDRVYDYDLYNDLGNPDKGSEYARPTLGGKYRPYPRRCRTGRNPNVTDMTTESPVKEEMTTYVPRDEAFTESKAKAIAQGRWKGLIKNFILGFKIFFQYNESIKEFSDINLLYKKRPTSTTNQNPLPSFVTKIINYINDLSKFDPPKSISIAGEDTCCLRDDEFGRLTLSGLNPLSIERLKVFPPVSKLNPDVYGVQESALKEEHIIGHLDGLTVQQAMEDKKLYILDYYDLNLPFLNRINAVGERKMHATRAIFFLTPLSTLKPIAIELSLPNIDLRHVQSNQVVTPPKDDTSYWLWQLAKTHVCSNDAAAHQLIHHWLRVHACMEPLIIAANRQLSVMHPIYKLLKPHMRDTLSINAQAREVLINAKGIIESYFTPERYCMEITQSAYQDWWRFDLEGLPADLIRRGMAEPDPTQEYGLRLLIEDYPYANDGLLIWSAIEKLVTTYVKHYYPDSRVVQFDNELQDFYKEFINVGHADISKASWWPKLSTPDDLISLLTTVIWTVTALHAAINFGQYHYGGYVPVRPPYMRRLVPKEGDDMYPMFLADPQGYFLSALPSLAQSTFFMSVLDILSTHCPVEEYIGHRKDLSTWSSDNEILEAFYNFSMEMKKIEKVIERRNCDPKLKNRCGPGVSPYESLMPSSGPGDTGRGIPNSISM